MSTEDIVRNIARSVQARAPSTAPSAVSHAVTAGKLGTNQALRVAGSATDTMRAFAGGIDPASVAELLQMQQAVWQRYATLSRTWSDSWQQWVRYASMIGGANTMSKFAEREYNIFAQAQQIASGQMVDMIGLIENVQVDYQYWISEKLADR
jgi:hypothetical protein